LFGRHSGGTGALYGDNHTCPSDRECGNIPQTGASKSLASGRELDQHTTIMKPWIPEFEPHTNPPAFRYDSNHNNPVKDDKIQLGRDRLDPNVGDAHAKAWAIACNKVLDLVKDYNDALEDYKEEDPGGADPLGDTAKLRKYRAAVNDLRKFLRKGYEADLEPGTFAMEAVESCGYVVAVRIYGRVIDRLELRHQHSSSSSYFSMYSPPC